MGAWKLYAYQGEMLTVAEIASRCGLDVMLIYNRLHRGYTMEEATAAPAQTYKRYPYRGEMLTIRQLAAKGGVSERTIWWRLERLHLTAEEAVKYAKPDRKKRYLYHGEMLTMDEIAAKSGVPKSTFRRRMTEYGLSADEAAVHDVSEWMTKYVYKGKHMTLARIAQATGISRNTLASRLNQGWTLEEATERPVTPKPSQRANATQIPPEADVPPQEREQWIAAQKIARTVTTPDLRTWHFKRAMPGVYAFEGTLIAWQIVFGRGNLAHLKASWKKTGKPMDYDRVFEVDGERVKEVVPEWWP